MLAFFMFVFVMAWTPGPNTIMSMVSGQQRGFKNSLRLNLGMFIGVGIIGLIAALFANWLKNTHEFIFSMKIIGSCYLAYLTYHVFISTPENTDNKVGDFNTGILLQLTNIKVYLFFITGLSAFTLDGVLEKISVRWLAMVLISGAGTIAWTIFGQVINRVYQRYYRYINTIVSFLLVLSIIDLWH
ncbi:LysE family transporter [Liquorilactobacillus mali]|uniref:LysE family translocator n=1 Tax=Liquorilactobacillus mali TaxID=1618 RepID=UPI002655595C|nr:LysE family transporter [Liquorilactobacillus mali]MDN7144980.1 LysE family transporter [Liquorilactobacillus mali]